MNEHVSASKLAERLLLRPEGATMDEIIAATGGPQYNVLRRLKARGFAVRGTKEGRKTRYHAAAPGERAFETRVDSKGQVTLPKAVREALRLRPGQPVRFAVKDGAPIEITPARISVQRLFGVLGAPPRKATPEEIGNARGDAAVERYLPTVSKPRR